MRVDGGGVARGEDGACAACVTSMVAYGKKVYMVVEKLARASWKNEIDNDACTGFCTTDDEVLYEMYVCLQSV